jgi:2-methylcitrate dehydratase
LKGEIGYPSALTAPTWGFYDVSFGGNPFSFQRSYGTYVMENVLFKISYPAEFHAQTSVEAAVQLHPLVVDRLDEVEQIVLRTHESAIRIISKTGPLNNFADRDHCLQYMTTIGLLKGDLTAEDYEDAAAADPRIDKLRDRMVVVEDSRYSRDYLDPELRSIANQVEVIFKDGSRVEKEVEYPIGHRVRREEGIPKLEQKFARNLRTCFEESRAAKIEALCLDHELLIEKSVPEFMDLLVP